MKTSPSMLSYPVFPDWVFEGQLEIDNNIIDAIINDVKSIQKSPAFNETNFGWMTNKGVMPGQNILKVNRLIHNLFVDNVKAQYRLGPENSQIEIVETWALGIKNSHAVPLNLERHRWYQSVLYLQASEDSSSLYFDQFGAKLYSTPVGVQPYTHGVRPAQNKLIFFPAHLPWGFAPNSSQTNTIVLCTSFIIKKS